MLFTVTYIQWLIFAIFTQACHTIVEVGGHYVCMEEGLGRTRTSSGGNIAEAERFQRSQRDI
jgi:hypothetical protein